MRVLLDTDVVLDLYLDREPFAEQAEKIWQANERGVFAGYVAAITPVNLFYIARKLRGAATARQAVTALLAALRVCPVDLGALKEALALPFKDYEDAVQHASAEASGLDAIVTRNGEDYAGARLAVMSPVEFVKKMAIG